ncbi:GNAT family N-acetyltransferase [Parabacteroides distasonis]|uniref:GNAT family N-acetyltransferase n=1 Tax=Parabacteroides distasonis TaxID=823 RepID=A0A4S2F0H0_PARDI|nr:GNAT family N-acetyltransferase [Parabacteroides distasonis]TGY62369.1 GNAT family N-acetyltransferase [Parabacteroides distasonis]
MDKKQQIVNLWRTCFRDSEAFISLYFDRVYKDENTMTIEKDGKIVSALQIVPYTMTYLGNEISVGYISGACTAPEERGQGLMRELLQKTFEEMERREIAISTLIPADPWLFDYYREQGYTEAFDYSVETYIRPNTPVQLPKITVIQPEVPTTDELFAYFNRKLRERPSCILHSQDDFFTILRDLQLDNGGMYTALDENEKVVGMAFALTLEADTVPSGKKLLIKELLYDSEEIKELLLQELTQQNNVSQTTVNTPPIPPSTLPMGMARIIDTKRMIHLWLSKQHENPVSKKDLEQMDNQTLTRQLMGYQGRMAYMSLMLD